MKEIVTKIIKELGIKWQYLCDQTIYKGKYEKIVVGVTKKYLKEKYTNKLIMAEQGGLWKVTPELIAVLAIYPTSTLILLEIKNLVSKIRYLESKLKYQDFENF